jgi:S-adenosylmethionine:tRNA ribosyltransferase-isomerase
MKTSDFDYQLPPDRIAQTPIEPRDHSKLLILNKSSGIIEHKRFYDLPEYLSDHDVLVFNDSRVIPARLFGTKDGSESKIEVLLLRRTENNTWECLVKPGKKVLCGAVLKFRKLDAGGNVELEATVVEQRENGIRVVRFSDETILNMFGKMPLPPYIHTPLTEPERYQTVYSRITGSAAAPTAGLHFTRELLDKLRDKGVEFAFTTLHIGLDTFRPVRSETAEDHRIHTEYGELDAETANLLNRSRKEGRRIVAVGTSTVRIIESAAVEGRLRPFAGNTNLFILPGFRFNVTDAMITNFHTPKSTLLMLVSAFAGRDRILESYQQAINSGYRFFSFGDAMFMH